MTATRNKAPFVRLLAIVAVLALVAVACTSGTTETTSTSAAGGETTTTAGGGGTATTTPMTTETTTGGGGAPIDTYTMGIFEDMTTDNYWNSVDSTGSTVWNSYVLTPTKGAMYNLASPGLEMVPDLAASQLPDAVQDGDVWTATVTLKDGIQFSDGTPITANDVAFTWHTAVDLGLGGNWPDYVDTDVVTNVEATDDSTVKVTFNAEVAPASWATMAVLSVEPSLTTMISASG